MTTKEMIAVLEHYENGGEVECENVDETWFEVFKPCWNFEKHKYRIKEKPKTKIVWFWKMKSESGIWFMVDYMYTEKEIKSKYEKCLEYKRMDILGSEEVPND